MAPATFKEAKDRMTAGEAASYRLERVAKLAQRVAPSAATTHVAELAKRLADRGWEYDEILEFHRVITRAFNDPDLSDDEADALLAVQAAYLIWFDTA